jgi:hypothetical protein
MSTRLSETIALLHHETRSIDQLGELSIDAEGVIALAGALKGNTSVTDINSGRNAICDEGAAALADALNVNKSVTTINVCRNDIGVHKRLPMR